MFSRENLDWMNEAPKMSYNEILGRPVFLNAEAFYVCLSGTSNPDIFEKVEFEIDENFENFYKKETGDTQVSPEKVSRFISSMVTQADDDYQNFDTNQGVDVFTVPQDNPNSDDQADLTWQNTENMDKASQKYNSKLHDRVWSDKNVPTTEAAISGLGEQLSSEAKTFAEYRERSRKNT